MPVQIDVIGYMYKADTYCPECIIKVLKSENKIMKSFKVTDIEETLNVLSDTFEIDRMDEWSFDSDEFPKVILSLDKDFSIDFCGKCDIIIE